MHDTVDQVLGYARAVWRRRWASLGVAWLVCLAAWAVVALLPDQYESRARIFADTDSMLGPLMKGITVDTDISRQIEVMQRTLLSRPNLEQVARMSDLDLTVDGPQDFERLLGHLEDAVAIDAEGRNLFAVSYSDPSPAVAQRVVQALLTIFIEGNLGASRRDMDTARRFIDEQIRAYERELDAAEARLAEFKKRNVGYLPGQGNYYQRLQEAHGRVTSLRSDIDSGTALRDELERQLAAVPLVIEADDPLLGFNLGGRSGDDPAASLAAMEAELNRLLGRYTPRHPAVVALRRDIEHLTSAGAASGDGGGLRLPTRRIPNPVYEQLKIELIRQEAALASLHDRLAKEEVYVRELTGLAQTIPQVEAELTRLNRDYQVIKSNFEELLSRREAARMAQELEIKTDKVEFRVIDPPTLPLEPTGPPRLLYLAGVLFAGIAAGVAYAAFLGQLDGAFDNARRLQEAFGLPVFGSVSFVASRAVRRHRRLALSGFALACLALIGVFGALVAAEQLDLLVAVGDRVRSRLFS